MTENLAHRYSLLASVLLAVFLLGGCKSQQPASPSPAEKKPIAAQEQEKIKTLTRCVQLLADSMKDPQQAFHFSFRGQENLNPKFPKEKGARPDIGPVELQADFTPEAVSLVSKRGKLRTERKVRKGEEPGWSLSRLDLLSTLASTSSAMALASSAARPAGNGTVAGVPADEFEFDTRTAAGAEAVGVEMTRSMLTNLKNAKGSAWVEKDTGRLLKFSIDAYYAEKGGPTWQEHYEGEVLPMVPRQP